MSIQISDITPIFRDVLENDTLIINENTKSSDVDEWDSLRHIYLVVSIEKAFKVKFTTYEIQGWTCVGDMLANLNSKKQ